MIQNESIAEHKPDGDNRGTPSRARELLWIGCGVVSAVWRLRLFCSLGRAERAGQRTDVVEDTEPRSIDGRLPSAVGSSELQHSARECLVVPSRTVS